jgi:hypothetical protein
MKAFATCTLVLTYFSCFSQGFIASLDKDDMDLALINKPTIVKLVSGEEITGKFGGATIISGYLDRIIIKKENGEKAKIEPEEIERLSIKASKLAKLSMMAEATASIKTLTNANFEEIVNREYIIFETALRSNKAAKPRLMQLLNPGFDSKIKVFADPNARETGGVGIGGVSFGGGVDKSYLFVQNDEKSVLVKKGSYKKNFEELYQNCPKMLESFSGEKIKWDDVAGHVFAFDRICSN